MKTNLLLTATVVLFIVNANAQLTYNKAFTLGNNANDQGYSIVADANGNFYCTGNVTYWMNANPLGTPHYTTNNGGKDIYVAKYNSAGIMAWVLDIGGKGDDLAIKITLDNTNNVYITGRFTDSVDFDPGVGMAMHVSHGGVDIFLAKYDNNGVFQWANTFGGIKDEQGGDLTVDPVSGNVIITGVYASDSMDMDPGNGVHDIYNNGYHAFNTGNCFVAAYDQSTGAYQWAFNIGGYGGATGYRVVTDNAGNLFVGGTVSGDSTDFDPGAGTSMIYCTNPAYKVFLAKYSSSNNLVWVNGFGGTWGQTANSLAVDNNGGVYQGGYFNSDSMDIDPGPGAYYLHNYPNGVQDIYVAKFNSSNGNLNWAFDVGGYYSEVAQDLVLDNAGHFFITGNFGDTIDFDPGPGTHSVYGNLGSDAYLAEYDTAGHFIDVVPIIGNGSNFGIGVCMIPPDKVGITGWFSADSADCDPGPAVHNLYVNGGNPTFTDAFVAIYVYTSTDINELAVSDLQFAVFPNPASSLLTVRCSEKFREIKIFDVLGSEVSKSDILHPADETQIMTSDFSTGIYFIQLKTENRTVTQKFVKL